MKARFSDAVTLAGCGKLSDCDAGTPRGLAGGIVKLNLKSMERICTKCHNQSGRSEGVRWRNALKKSMIALLAGVLLLSAAMPAFAKKHHKKHHHHHSHHATQVTR
jgi:hypothetical protein